ncbi:MAG TPA: Minf_1886 family protein [bacterium]|nr:Minf_1886 family protein [bacterium]
MSEPLDKFDEVFGDLDHSYSHRAYRFVLAAVGHLVGRLSEPRHITGQELLVGLVDLGRNHFGPLAGEVFAEWGVKKPLDFGKIVFELVRVGLLGKTAEDDLHDFEKFPGFSRIGKDYDWLGEVPPEDER